MGEFEKPIGRVRRRLWFQRYVSALVWCLTLLLSVAALALALEKFRVLPIPGPWWIPPAVASALAVVAAAVVAWFTVPSRIDAAVAIDHRFELQERVSTALSLPADLRQTPVGQAVLHDALRHLEGLDLAQRFALTRPRLAWIPIVPAVAAVGIALLPDALLAREAAKPPLSAKQNAETKKAVNQALKAVAENLAQKREPKSLAAGEADKVLAELQKGIDDLTKKPPADKQQTLVALNKLADTVQERRKQFGSSEQMSRQLQQLKEMAAGPAEEFSRDLAKGDFQKAADDLKKLQDKLANGQMSEQEKQELQRQLSQLKKELDKMAGLEERKKQLEEARKNGMISEQQYQQQKQKLEEQSKTMKSLQSLANKLGEAQKEMAAGNSQKASDALKSAEQQLQEMASSSSELEALDSAMADLQDAKDALTGEGMNQLGQDLQGMAGMLDSMGRQSRFGMGGRGRGQGDRPEAPDKTASYDSKVKQQITKGKAVLGGFADPTKQVRGESVLEVQGNVEAAASAASEALTDQKIPSTLKKHVQSYFDQVRKGE
jgi:myosin heavy subunit